VIRFAPAAAVVFVLGAPPLPPLPAPSVPSASAPKRPTPPPLPKKPVPAPKPPTAPVRVAPPPQKPSVRLPSLPSLGRVRVEVGTGGVLVVQDVNIPKGDWSTGDVAVYVAFGAPGVPEALDAFVLSVADGALGPREGDVGEAVTVERAPRRPASVEALLGPETMAGVVVRIESAAFARATEAGRMATLRVRSAIASPRPADDGGREVLVRLGSARGTPLTLGLIEVVPRDAKSELQRVEAALVGPEADDHPLAVAFPAVTLSAAQRDKLRNRSAIAPVLAVRHGSDDLVVRYWIDGSKR